MEQLGLLSHIKKKLNEPEFKELARWHEVQIQEREYRRRGFYIPSVKRRMNNILGSTDISKKYASHCFQLKVGYGAIGAYWAKIGVVETPQCWSFDQAEQSVEYLLKNQLVRPG